jgi:hypothetical protein
MPRRFHVRDALPSGQAVEVNPDVEHVACELCGSRDTPQANNLVAVAERADPAGT